MHWKSLAPFLLLLIASINADPAIHHHSGAKNHHSVFDDHPVTIKSGLRGVFIYTYEPATHGADVFVQQVDLSTYESFFSNKKLVTSPKNISSSFDFLRLLDDRCDIAIKCRPCEQPATLKVIPTTTPRVTTTTPKVTTTTPRKTTTTPRTTTTTPKPTTTTTPFKPKILTTPGPTYLPPVTTTPQKQLKTDVFRGPSYLPVEKKTTTRGPTTPPPTYTYKVRSFAQHTPYTFSSRSYIYPTHANTWTPPAPRSRVTTTYQTTTKAPQYQGEYIFANGTKSGPISESLRRYYDNLYAKERGLGSDYVDNLYKKEEEEGYYRKFRV